MIPILYTFVIIIRILAQEMYRTLVDKYGANPWAPNIHGDTPLLLACRRSLNMAQVEILWPCSP